jgi:putative addiction module component (TIGR02574 family)
MRVRVKTKKSLAGKIGVCNTLALDLNDNPTDFGPMTLATLKKAVLQLPESQRVKLANALVESLPLHREAVTFEELQRRADEVISGKVKAVTSDEFDARIDQLMQGFSKKRNAQRRLAQRG